MNVCQIIACVLCCLGPIDLESMLLISPDQSGAFRVPWCFVIVILVNAQPLLPNMETLRIS